MIDHLNSTLMVAHTTHLRNTTVSETQFRINTLLLWQMFYYGNYFEEKILVGSCLQQYHFSSKFRLVPKLNRANYNKVICNDIYGYG